ncbi:flavin-containing monooxygenase [Fibrella aquatilis]|uniref:NAD(P)-binding domain-containing protein n=1 Tax=Fibrella aquatilis TaxID=2817059 RepID=A0A939G7W4_9BACT|nr:NAD(P)/FAD-dependent oxidoreductase [Fibrella aquatilis]MBO0931787.1 NAD(P)-binding domain-containing protein [Fibrella aquatilis]
MNTPILDVIVIGAGHAGLSASYYLKQAGLAHLVLERGRVGESWRSQRWASFVVNSPNQFNRLPDTIPTEDDPGGFSSAHTFVATLTDYALAHELPIIEDTTVLSIEKSVGDDAFTIAVSRHDQFHTYRSRQVIVASGAMNTPQIPTLAGQLLPAIQQRHVATYRQADQLPDGGVLVVGSGQSGCQVAEDLAEAGRAVYLATSPVARLPRRYRGKDIMEWLVQMGFFNARAEDVPDPAMLHLKTPLLTGRDGGQRTLSLQSLARKGVTLLGSMTDADDTMVAFAANAAMHVQFADEFSAQVKGMVDAFIQETGLTAPAPTPDPDDAPDPDVNCVDPITSLNLTGHGVTSVIWATGFGADFSYLHLPVFDSTGQPEHHNGITSTGGLYFLGLHWLRSRKSTTLLGLGEDARFIVDAACAYHQQCSELA